MSHGAASALLKQKIEAQLATRIPGALSPLPPPLPRLFSTGVAAVDRLLGGGFPLGGVTEVAGAAGSGRTALAFALLAQATREGACAYVDLGDCLDPVSAAAAGVRMENLLWVRLRSRSAPLLPPPALRSHPAGDAGQLRSTLARTMAARQQRQEGTPGHPNQGFGLLAAPEEQVAYERLFERGNRAPAPRPESGAEAKQPLPRPPAASAGPPKKPWSLLDGAIRAADQVLQAGGFRAVVFDLAAAPPEQARRVPAATWFRFAQAAKASDAVLLLMTGQPCAGSSAACVLSCSPETVCVDGSLLAATHTVEVARQRIAGPLARKAPGRSASWHAVSPWACGARA